MRRRHGAGCAAVLALACAAGGLAACRDSRRLPTDETTEPAGPATVKGRTLDERASPEDVARGLLELLARSVEIRRGGLGGPQRAEEYVAVRSAIGRLAAGPHILATASADPHGLMPAALNQQRAVAIVTDYWPAAVGYYIEGLKPESMKVQEIGPDEAFVSVEAENPHARQMLDEIRASLAGQRDARGHPLQPGTEAYAEAVRRAALARGVGLSFGARIEIMLVREEGGWRAARLSLGPTSVAGDRGRGQPGEGLTQPMGTQSG